MSIQDEEQDELTQSEQALEVFCDDLSDDWYLTTIARSTPEWEEGSGDGRRIVDTTIGKVGGPGVTFTAKCDEFGAWIEVNGTEE